VVSSLFYTESSGLILAFHRLFLSADFNCFLHGFFRFEQLLRLDKLLELGFVHVRDVDGKETIFKREIASMENW